MTDNKLIDLALNAVQTSCELLRQQKTAVTGYALCTDDNIWTLYHVASSTPHGGPKPYWANPVDWCITAAQAKPLFVGISEYLRTQAQQAAAMGRLEQHVDRAFESLVTVLEQLRPKLQQLGSSELLLLVASTDPSPKLVRMEINAARRLNSGPLFEEWYSALHGQPAEKN